MACGRTLTGKHGKGRELGAKVSGVEGFTSKTKGCTQEQGLHKQEQGLHKQKQGLHKQAQGLPVLCKGSMESDEGETCVSSSPVIKGLWCYSSVELNVLLEDHSYIHTSRL